MAHSNRRQLRLLSEIKTFTYWDSAFASHLCIEYYDGRVRWIRNPARIPAYIAVASIVLPRIEESHKLCDLYIYHVDLWWLEAFFA